MSLTNYRIQCKSVNYQCPPSQQMSHWQYLIYIQEIYCNTTSSFLQCRMDKRETTKPNTQHCRRYWRLLISANRRINYQAATSVARNAPERTTKSTLWDNKQDLCGCHCQAQGSGQKKDFLTPAKKKPPIYHIIFIFVT